MATKLILGLRQYNKDNNKLWTVPRKGTAPHSNLLKIMGREDLAKRQDEYRHNQIIKRQEELSRLEHNLGVVVKVNKIRKFLGTAKEKIAEKKKKKTEVPSVAEQVLFNPDLLRKIGGYKKDMERVDEEDKIEKELEKANTVEDTLFALARLNAGNKWDEDDRFSSMLDEIEGYEDQYVDAIVEHLKKKGRSVKWIVKDMKSMDEGYTMFDDYIEENS